MIQAVSICNRLSVHAKKARQLDSADTLAIIAFTMKDLLWLRDMLRAELYKEGTEMNNHVFAVLEVILVLSDCLSKEGAVLSALMAYPDFT